MNLYVPDIGDIIKLTKDWSFYLQDEHRNKLDLDLFGTGKTQTKDNVSIYNDTDNYNEVIMPKTSVLKIDRIYIRKGASGFSSITFILLEIDGKKFKHQRFWAKLKDCNNIQFELDTKPNVKIQWKNNYIFKGKDSMPNDINGVAGIFNTHILNMPLELTDHVNHKYSENNILEGLIDGNVIPYSIKENVNTRLLNDDEKDAIRDDIKYQANNYRSVFRKVNKLELQNILDHLRRINDWKLEIINTKGEVVKTCKSLTTAKKWIKTELSK